MGKATGFLEYARETPTSRPVPERVNDHFEIYQPFPKSKVQEQGARCMDCGVPFCHTGCPLHNLIPDWNDLVWKGDWQRAVRLLHSTNNFPEFTGRLCPAPCEAACVLGINQPPVSIKVIEKAIIDQGFEHGWIRPEPPAVRTGKRVAIVGSGPAGLAAAQQLNRAGHEVTVFERSDRPGGLLRYGIPDFKMDKGLLERRLSQLLEEGIHFEVNAEIGGNVPVEDLRKNFHAILLALGSEQPRELPVPGRELKGIHWAMDYLTQHNRRVAGEAVDAQQAILATGKRVAIIGGGDTGADCLGTCHRQKAAHVYQFEHNQQPPLERSPLTPWPLWPMMLRMEGAHEEGGQRDWAVATTGFSGNGHVKKLHAVRVGPKPGFAPVPGSEFALDVDLVLLAMGYSGPRKAGLVDQLGLALDARGNLAATDYATSVPGIFAAGDARRGQSLVVWAIAEGRQAAAAINRSLTPA